jgi:photosystem II stability/assembly factor-like uncharacterized protein
MYTLSQRTGNSMKATLFGTLLSVIVLTPCICLGQPEWRLIHPQPTNENLSTVFFSSSAMGYIVGDYGTILRSTDGGDSWEAQPSGTINALASIHFFNDRLGVVVGERGTILRTTDGGITWTLQSCPTTSDLKGVAFPSRDTPGVVFAVGYNATVLRSDDQGQTWVHVHVDAPAKAKFEDITFTSKGWGAIVGYYCELYSFDGGATWVNRSRNYLGIWKVSAVSDFTFATPGLYYSFPHWWGLWIVKDSAKTFSQKIQSYGMINSVHFINERSGCIVGDGIHRTDDGGVTWTAQPGNANWRLVDVFFTDSLNGTVVGWGGVILRSKDAGATWHRVSPQYSARLTSVSFASARVGHAVGTRGSIMSTSDGGQSWSLQSSDHRLYLTRIVHITDSIALSVGGLGVEGIIVRSSDGGAHWARDTVGSGTWYDVVFIDTAIGVVIGEKGSIAGTTDAGLTWTKRDQNITTSSFVAGTCIHENEAAILFVLTAEGLILRSTDVGTTWRRWSTLPSGEYTDLSHLDASTAFVCGKNGIILKTTNGGASWHEVQHVADHGHMYRIVTRRLENGTFILAAGENGLILHTTDGGSTWLRHSTATGFAILDVHFIDSLTGIATGDRATILNTSNGGLTWTDSPSSIPAHPSLGQLYPHPVSASTTIPFTLTKTEYVTLIVHDMLGRRVTVLVDEVRTAGSHAVLFNARGLLPGIYFVTLLSSSGRCSGKLAIVSNVR